MIAFFSKEKIFKINKLLIGNDDEFQAEHQILNGSIIIVGIIFLITFIINYISGLSKNATIIAGFSIVIFLFLYYFSRFKKLNSVTIFLFHFSLFCILTITWFYSGGIISTMPLYYLTFICYIVFFSKGPFRLILVLICLANIVSLSIIEFYHPEYVAHYPNREVQISFMIKGFLMSVLIVIHIINSAKRIYLKEKQNTIDIIDQYRNNGEMLKKEYNNKIEQLSLRERNVFQLIIEGNSNQEIAEKLFIEVGTVKIHINKIYKKLGTKDRKETINYCLKHK